MASKPVSLSAQLPDLPVVRGHAPWPGHEYVKGWGVFGLPFDSGHVLALHVFPENDFSPYRTVWHRDPGGRWSIHVDGPRGGLPRRALRKSYIEEVPVETGSVDVVISNGVINLCADKPAVLTEIARVLKPGGRERYGSTAAHTLRSREQRPIGLGPARGAATPRATSRQAPVHLRGCARRDRQP